MRGAYTNEWKNKQTNERYIRARVACKRLYIYGMYYMHTRISILLIFVLLLLRDACYRTTVHPFITFCMLISYLFVLFCKLPLPLHLPLES